MTAHILTIAGTDPSGGAGISADIKTFSALGTYAMYAITCVVAQNTQGVRAFLPLSTEFIKQQLACVFEDVEVHAVKIGMIATAEIAQTIATVLDQYKHVPVVLDPVMVAKSGDILLEKDAIEAVRKLLVPRATIMTPNIHEAAVLLDCQAPNTLEQMQAMMPKLVNLGAQWTLLKGGNLLTQSSTDLLADKNCLLELNAPRIQTSNVHGTGCTLSAAIAAFLPKYSVQESVMMAKNYLTEALVHSNELHVGHGHGPVHHFHHLWPINEQVFCKK